MIWIAFGVGLFVGTFIGILVVGLCQMAARLEVFQRRDVRDHSRIDALLQPSFAESGK